jgi:hypothetical protein
MAMTNLNIPGGFPMGQGTTTNGFTSSTIPGAQGGQNTVPAATTTSTSASNQATIVSAAPPRGTSVVKLAFAAILGAIIGLYAVTWF